MLLLSVEQIHGAISSFGEKDILAQVGWLDVKSIVPWTLIISSVSYEPHADFRDSGKQNSHINFYVIS